MPFKIEGLMCASFTPMTADREVDIKAIDAYQKYLVDCGIECMYVNGSTGEGPLLTTQERKDIIAEWVRLSRLPGRSMKIFVQVGGTTDKEIMELARHAASIKVDAVSALPSLYFTPTCVDDLVDQCKRISENAPGIPFYYYHIPIKSGVNLNMHEFLQKCSTRVPDFRGIKFTSKDLYEGAKCLRTRDGNGDLFDILYGCDEQLIGAFAMGFKAGVGSTYNLMPGVYKQMYALCQAGDWEKARVQQYRSVDVVKILFDYGTRCGGLMSAQKAVLHRVGAPVGPTRYPLTELSEGEKDKLMKELEGIGFLDWQANGKL